MADNDSAQCRNAPAQDNGGDNDGAIVDAGATTAAAPAVAEPARHLALELERTQAQLRAEREGADSTNQALTRAQGDWQNLIAASDIGALFLDCELRIQRFTEPVRELVPIEPADEGRSIADFADRHEFQDVVRDARAVLANRTAIRREIRSPAGRTYDMRARPYLNGGERTDGVVITFIDITEHRLAEQALRIGEEAIRHDQRLVELSRDPIFIWDFDGGILLWNRGSEELYGYSRREAIGRRKDQLLATQVPGSSFAALRAKLLDEGSYSGEVKHRTKDGRELTIETRIVLETMGGKRLALESTRDVTERKQWERRQRLLLGELTHRVRNTLSVVQALARQSLRTSKSGEEFVERFDGRLASLARAHTLLVNSDWHGADLATLAQSQLEAYRSDNPARVQLDGQAVTLPADLATPFGLILHELATNAAKYGSLSRPSGSIVLSWAVDWKNGDRVLKVTWREQGGPPVEPPAHDGLGGGLIEKGIPRATVRREFAETGLVCTIEMSLPQADESEAIETD